MSASGKDDHGRSATAGRVVLALIGVSLIAIGALFIALMMRSYLRAKEMRDWPEVPCVILESRVEERQHDPYSPTEYSHRVTFGYQWQSQALTSNRLSLRGSKWSSKPRDAQEAVDKYPVGSQQKCRVNPQKVDLAVLEVDSLAPLYSIWFPALFVAGGIGILVTSLRSRPDE